jgi:hypothetical protein
MRHSRKSRFCNEIVNFGSAMEGLLLEALRSERAGVVLLRLLDMRSWVALRATSGKLRFFFSLDKFLEAVALPVSDKLQEEALFTQLIWLFGLPAFKDDLSQFPHFRVRGAVARLAEGALRMLSMERLDGRLYLVGNIQPSMSWGASHLVYFEVFRDGLEFRWCKCRNG